MQNDDRELIRDAAWRAFSAGKMRKSADHRGVCERLAHNRKNWDLGFGLWLVESAETQGRSRGGGRRVWRQL